MLKELFSHVSLFLATYINYSLNVKKFVSVKSAEVEQAKRVYIGDNIDNESSKFKFETHIPYRYAIWGCVLVLQYFGQPNIVTVKK